MYFCYSLHSQTTEIIVEGRTVRSYKRLTICGRLACVMIVYKPHRLKHVLLFHTSLSLYVVCNHARSDSDDDEIDDKELNNILIVTQTPPYMKKHPQGDRHPNPDYLPRAKMSAEIAKVINEGLCCYEEELWNDQEVRDETFTCTCCYCL